ncbi:MAG: hypothetical protein ACE5FA_12265 [Dehalococcoidia bacterium]
MRESLLEAFPDVGAAVSIVWTHMLPPDSEAETLKASEMFSDGRVTQFHDPNRLAGIEVGRGLGWSGDKVAWDIYLFYEKGAQWSETPPSPMEWAHQLFNDSQADSERFHTGQALIDRLREVAEFVW